mgnify:CR=1 FL=1|jgi:hypothetical protein
MFTDLKTIFVRSGDTLLQDFAGAAALAVMLVGMLSLPGVY